MYGLGMVRFPPSVFLWGFFLATQERTNLEAPYHISENPYQVLNFSPSIEVPEYLQPLYGEVPESL